MASRVFGSVAVCLLLLSRVSGHPASSARRCSIGTTPFYTSLGETYFLAEFLDQVVPVAPGPVESSDFEGHASCPIRRDRSGGNTSGFVPREAGPQKLSRT